VVHSSGGPDSPCAAPRAHDRPTDSALAPPIGVVGVGVVPLESARVGWSNGGVWVVKGRVQWAQGPRWGSQGW